MHTYFADVVLGDQDVASSQVSVDEALLGKIVHPIGDLS